MFTTLLSAALLPPAAPVPKDFQPDGPAPYFLNLTPDADGVVRVFPRTSGEPVAILAVPIRVFLVIPLDSLADLRITTADGKAVAIREAAKLLAAGTPAVASADGRPVGAAHRRNLTPGTLMLVSSELATQTAGRATVGAPTQASRWGEAAGN